MADRPTRVKVGPLWYRVEWMSGSWRTGCRRNGECCYAEQTLRICEALDTDRMATCFLHEVWHAVSECYNCGDTQHQEGNYEAVANAVAMGLSAFWQDNPKAFEWWISLVKGGLAAEAQNENTQGN